MLLTLRAYDQCSLGLNCQTLFIGPLLLLFWSSSRLAFFWPRRMHLHMRLYVFIFIRNTKKNGPLGIFVWQSSSIGMVDDNWTTHQPGRRNPSSLSRTEPNTNDALFCVKSDTCHGFCEVMSIISCSAGTYVSFDFSSFTGFATWKPSIGFLASRFLTWVTFIKFAWA